MDISRRSFGVVPDPLAAGEPPTRLERLLEHDRAAMHHEQPVQRLAVDIVAQRAAPLGDRVGERRAHLVDEPLEARLADPVRGAGGPDAGPEQRFVRIDVPDADDDMVVHQRELDGRGARPERAVEVGGVELR